MDPGKEEQEKEGKMDFPHGVLSQLEQLECQARGRAAAQERRERLQERREFLKNQIRELRQRRERLRERLRQAELGNLGIPSDPDPREVLEWRIRNCRDLLQMFRLTGISGKLIKHGISFSLHTSFEGSLLDSFHVELQEFREFREFRVRRHSVPPFIPLERLSQEFLPKEPREFLGILFQHLNAFVARRHQLQKFQEEFSEFIQGIPSQNSLYNLLSFHYRIPGGNSGKFPEFREFRARLLYRDPLRSLPSDVSVSSREGIPVPEHSELFQSLSLPRAFREIRAREMRELAPGVG